MVRKRYILSDILYIGTYYVGKIQLSHCSLSFIPNCFSFLLVVIKVRCGTFTWKYTHLALSLHFSGNKKRIFQFASSFMSSSSFHLDLHARSASFFGPQVNWMSFVPFLAFVKHSIDHFLRSVLANQKSVANLSERERELPACRGPLSLQVGHTAHQTSLCSGTNILCSRTSLCEHYNRSLIETEVVYNRITLSLSQHSIQFALNNLSTSLFPVTSLISHTQLTHEELLQAKLGQRKTEPKK